MKKLFVAVCATVLGAFSLNAQSLAVRAEVGGNFTNIEAKLKEEKINADMLLGLRGGVALEVGLVPMTYIATGVNYRMGGAQKSSEIAIGAAKGTKEEKIRDHSVAVPLNFGLRVPVVPGLMKLSVEGGPYVSYKLKSESFTELKGELGELSAKAKAPEKKNLLEDEGAKRLEAGIGASVAAEFNTLYLRLGTTIGLTDVNKNKDIDWKNQEFYLNLGIRF